MDLPLKPVEIKSKKKLILGHSELTMNLDNDQAEECYTPPRDVERYRDYCD